MELKTRRSVPTQGPRQRWTDDTDGGQEPSWRVLQAARQREVRRQAALDWLATLGVLVLILLMLAGLLDALKQQYRDDPRWPAGTVQP